MTLLRRLSTATAAATLALVAIGGVVRATGSGDACPDWPRCFGKLIPPFEFHTLIEYSHRLSAAIAGVLIVATAWVAWRTRRRDPAILWPIVAAVGVVVVQAAIGRIRIEAADPAKPVIVTVHFLVAMALVGLVMITATATRVVKARTGSEHHIDRRFRALAWWTLGVTALLLLLGAYVRGSGAGLVFLDWPLMDGQLVPDLSSRATVAGFAHRLLAAGAVILGGTLAARSNRIGHRGIRVLAWSAFVLLIVQAGLGAAAVLTRLAPPAVAGHVAGSSLAWACLVALAVALGRLTTVRSENLDRPGRRTREVVGAYLQLTKPDIIVLLLVTTVPTMVLAAGGMPGWGLIGATLLGGALTAGGAGAINGFLDRDIDEVMRRTRRRPIPSHRVEPGTALRFGSVLIVSGTLWLALTVNLLSGVLALSAAAFYIFVYTVWMKRSTPQNIVIGGAAGAAPALIGWTAVTGTVELPAVILFAIVFYWTPPHFWALSLRYAGEYRAAGVPMLPVVQGRRETARHIFLYSLLLLSVSLLLFPVAGMGRLYLAASATLGGVFVGYAVRVLRDGGTRSAMSLFRYSITYLGLLFAAVAADQLVRANG
jgi:protoheme IX farnesyltransferase